MKTYIAAALLSLSTMAAHAETYELDSLTVVRGAEVASSRGNILSATGYMVIEQGTIVQMVSLCTPDDCANARVEGEFEAVSNGVVRSKNTNRRVGIVSGDPLIIMEMEAGLSLATVWRPVDAFFRNTIGQGYTTTHGPAPKSGRVEETHETIDDALTALGL